MCKKIFSFGCRIDAPIRQRRKPAAAAAREVIEREVGFQKNEVLNILKRGGNEGERLGN
jgi:hypothetical protein